MTHPMTPTPTPPGWRDISTAPRDGTAIKARLTNGDVETIRWDDGLWSNVNDVEFFAERSLTGWMPQEPTP